MQIFALLLAGLLGWAWWTGKISTQQIPALALMVIGAVLAARGQPLFGVAGIAVGAAWFAGSRRRIAQQQSGQYAIDKARHLLGASARDDADKIRVRHRRLIAENHPDTGGSDERARQLNEARDLLLAELINRP
ncbi:MAG: molecular chaperone DnaJ [Sphingorhabdus sp.]